MDFILLPFSLLDTSDSVASSALSQHLQRVWTCPCCLKKMAVSIAEQLAHQDSCTAPAERGACACVFACVYVHAFVRALWVLCLVCVYALS